MEKLPLPELIEDIIYRMQHIDYKDKVKAFYSLHCVMDEDSLETVFSKFNDLELKIYKLLIEEELKKRGEV